MTEEQIKKALPNNGINDILLWQGYINKYGENTTLKDVFERIKLRSQWAHLHYLCPKCNGSGYTVTEYNSYPSGLPDSGFIYRPGYDYKICSLCKGYGYTMEEYEPETKIEVVGYKLKKNEN